MGPAPAREVDKKAGESCKDEQEQGGQASDSARGVRFAPNYIKDLIRWHKGCIRETQIPPSNITQNKHAKDDS